MTLQSFPRGGEKHKNITTSAQLFHKNTEHKKKGKKKDKKKLAKESDQEFNFVAHTAERLSNATLCEGLTILGRICQVREYELIVSLPGGLNGQLKAPNISKSYNDLLVNLVRGELNHLSQYEPLTELYSVGEYIVCYVQSTQANGKWNIQLSLESHLINQNVDINYLVIGTRLVCSVSSVEDHGYIVDTGIPNVRAFISNKDVDADKKYFLGKQVFCYIKELRTTNNVTTINLSTKQKLIWKVIDYEIESLDVLTPGTRVPLRVRNILSNGLQVSYGKGHVGYINRIYMDKSVSSYTEDMTINGTLMYIMPTVKFGYFSLITNKKPEMEAQSDNMNRGDIVEKATVLFRESNGIVLRLNSHLRGFVSLHRTGISFDKVATKFIPDSVHKCRVLFYNWMEKMYTCTMQHDELLEKHFTESDLSVGDILRVQIRNINTENNYMTVNVGKMIGTVSSDHISDFGSNIMGTLKVGQWIEARVLNINKEKNKIQFTLKESLLRSNFPILSDIRNAKCGSRHHGTIVQINKNGLLVRFFGEVKGWLPCVYLEKGTASVNWNYSVGQTIAVYIESVNENEKKMKLNLISNIANIRKNELLIGQVVEGNVIEASTEGIRLQIKDKEEYPQEGFLPAGHMAPCIEIGRLLASKCIPGDVISALVFATEPSLLLSRTFLSDEKHRELKQLKVGDSIPSSVKDIAQDGVRVVLPINNYKKYGFVPYNKISNFDMIQANQMLFVKITNIDKKEEQLNLTMSLEKLWMQESDEGLKIMGSVDLLNLYFNKIKELVSNSYYKGRPISTASIGQVVTGRIDKITNHGLTLKLQNNLEGTVREEHYSGNVKVGDEVSGKILWINYVHEFVEVTLLPSIVCKINSKQNINVPTKTLLRGEIVMVSQWFILVLLKGKGKGTLAALPARRHVNDLRPDLRPYIFLSRIRCYAILNKQESDIMPICMLKSAFEISRKAALSKVMQKQRATSKKRSEIVSINEGDKTEELVKMQNYPKKNAFDTMVLDNGIERSNEDQSPRKRKLEEESVMCKNKKLKKKIQNLNAIGKTEDEFENAKNAKDRNKSDRNNQDKSDNEKNIKVNDGNVLGIPQCGFYWDTMPDSRLAIDIRTSSDSEDDAEEQKKSKVKKLSAAQRRERERQKEREIREREEALASNQMPNSVDQFDRLVLASPDSSLVWLQYMAYHLQATEVEKARAIARRAIKTINFREENEKLNVWNAWLNLESKFGTPEALNDVFQEAVRTNDALKVYTHMLTVHVEAGRQFELEKLVNTFIGKFKQNPQVWVECGSALLKLGLKDKSRQVMQRALQSLPLSEHVSIMLRFANLENQFGEKERSQTLFEQILSSYPKRVDIWSSYVDSLVKSEEIFIARKVLERAIVQNLPPKKMKVLFKKFISFEEKHGTPEDVEHVQRVATDYIENQCGERINTHKSSAVVKVETPRVSQSKYARSGRYRRLKLCLCVGSPWNNSSGCEEERRSNQKEGKKSNVLPLWGNERTMNLNPLILTNIQSSHYFKVNLYELKTYHEVIDEIYYKVSHLEPWEKGSRKTAGQTGMCGGVRGVGAGGIVSTAYCLLFKLFTLRLTRKQLNGLINHLDSPYIRALGFMYIRYTQPPADLFSWYSDYLEDEEEVDVKAGGGQVMKMGDILKQFLTKLEWFSTLFPRIPVPIQKELEHRLAERFPQQTINARNAKPPITLNSHGKYSNNSTSGRRDNGNLTRNQQPRHIPDYEAEWGEAERASHWRARSDEDRKDKYRKRERERDADRDRVRKQERDRARERDRRREGHFRHSSSRDRSRRSRDYRSRSRERSYRDQSRDRHRDKDRHRSRRSSPYDYTAALACEKERQRRE
uniref:rRNA biogenesis protein RRP5 n=1 Tax=Vespula pensylvanica TaxID=30213 RepID=A0A834UFS8_VESPE|nr:hypothetical protein H0235_004173 [Vespula pensylvanica]